MSYRVVSIWNTDAGLDACILFVNDSHHCGYVIAPESIAHLNYDDVDISVHGGLTYGGRLEALGNEFAFGFDCAHCDDKTKYNSSGIFRDATYVQAECENLAKQLIEFANISVKQIGHE